MTRFKSKYDRVYKSLSRLDLQTGALGLEEMGIDDLFSSEPELWLGFYTKEGLRVAFEKYGFTEDFKAQGYEEVRFEIYMNDPDEHMLRFWGVRPETETPLIELVVRRGHIRPQGALANRMKRDYINVLDVEWLQMQNPIVDFDSKRPPLPGQSHPGLGLGNQVMEMLRQSCKRLNLDGLVTTPAYFHNAFFYSEEFFFFDPDVQGLFLALCRDVLPQTKGDLGHASWAIYWKMVAHAESEQLEPFAWFHDPQVCPISPYLKEYFDSKLFHGDSLQALSSQSFRVLKEPLQEMLNKKGLTPFDLDKIRSWVHTPQTS